MIERCHEAFPVTMMCRLLKVSSSGYYEWRSRPVSQREAANDALLQGIRRLHDASDGVWGAPTITDELRLEGQSCSKNRVARLMRQHTIQGIPQKRQWRKKGPEKRPSGVENHLDRDFTAIAPNQKWVTDITYLNTGEGYLYLCIVKDLFCGSIVGWSMSARQTRELVLQSVLMALWQRPKGAPVYLHSDRGCQFTSREYQRFLKGHNLICSMSAVGSCADNASAESFFGQLKRERVNRRTYLTHAETRADIFDYIERFYNPRKQRQLAALDN
ncbi:transposase, partial [Solemya elarraichensis gill symbiont]